MIEITFGGNRAEADTPEAALVAARTMWDDVNGVTPGWRPTVCFLVDGVCVRTTSDRGELG